jgi:integrase
LIDELPIPQARRAYYRDARQDGLVLTVYPSGQKSFSLYRWVNGRPERIRIGPYPDLSLEQVRKEAEGLTAEIALGYNPAEERRAVREEMTFEELFNLYLEKHAKIHKRTWMEDVKNYNRYLSGLGKSKLSQIKSNDVLSLHARVGRENGHYAANRGVLSLLSSVFNLAPQWGWTGGNPAAGIKPFKEYQRKRFLDADELPTFFSALAEEQNTTIRDYFLAALLTGARRANVLAMRWAEIRWGRCVWEIPAEKAKADEAMDVPLVEPMLELLTRRKADPAADPVWVFPGDGKTGHLVEPKMAWARILKRAGINDCRMHDLRRTLGSWQAIQGASLAIIGRSLGHKSLQATQVYARLNADPVRASVARATDAMQVPRGLLKP